MSRLKHIATSTLAHLPAAGRWIGPFAVLLLAFAVCTTGATGGFTARFALRALVTAFALTWPVAFLPNIARQVLQGLIGTAAMATCCIDCYCQLFLNNTLTPQTFNVIFQTDLREAGEFFDTFIGWTLFSHWRIDALIALWIAYYVALLPFFSRWADRLAARRRGGKRADAAIALLTLACVVIDMPNIATTIHLLGDDTQKTEGQIFRHHQRMVPTPVHRAAFALYATHQSTLTLEGMKHATYASAIDSCSHTSPHIVLVIGESFNKHHASLYGYTLPTTPRQCRRADNGEMAVFDDVATPWNITSNVFVNLFSLWCYGDNASVADQPLFPALFRRAGYRVSFFSNQYVNGFIKRGSTNQAGSFFLADQQLSDSLFDHRNHMFDKYDMGLIGQYAEYADSHDTTPYTLDIIHLIGQHFKYSHRYPKNKERFAPSDYASRHLDDKALATVMGYDNATAYNDEVMDSLLSLCEDRDAVVIYVSDHGEEVYDELEVSGRLFQEPTAATARQEFSVPMWIWFSPIYWQRRPEVVEQARAATQRPLMTDALPHLLLYMAGIKCRDYDERHNMIGAQWQARTRTIGGGFDYDQLIAP